MKIDAINLMWSYLFDGFFSGEIKSILTWKTDKLYVWSSDKKFSFQQQKFFKSRLRFHRENPSQES